MYILLIYCRATGGELFRMIAVDPLLEHEAKKIVWELLEGVSHLHTLNIVHLDLKVCVCTTFYTYSLHVQIVQ